MKKTDEDEKYFSHYSKRILRKENPTTPMNYYTPYTSVEYNINQI